MTSNDSKNMAADRRLAIANLLAEKGDEPITRREVRHALTQKPFGYDDETATALARSGITPLVREGVLKQDGRGFYRAGPKVELLTATKTPPVKIEKAPAEKPAKTPKAPRAPAGNVEKTKAARAKAEKTGLIPKKASKKSS